jgi:hypothetical protein
MAKLLSDSAAPARCTLCHGLSHQNQAVPLIASILVPLGLAIAVGEVLEKNEWWPLLAFLVFCILSTVVGLALPSTRTSPSQSHRVRSRQIYVVIILLVGLFLVAFWAA